MFRMGLIAGSVAAVANVLVLELARRMGVSLLMPNPSGGADMPMHWFFPASLSLLAGLVAPAVLALCLRLAGGRGVLVWRIVAAVFLVLSFGGPFALPGQVDLATKVTLNLMHVVAAVPIMALVHPETKGRELHVR